MGSRGVLTVLATALVAGVIGYQIGAQGGSPDRLVVVVVIGVLIIVAIGFVATRPPARPRRARGTLADARIGWIEFDRELDRSRRHAHPMAIVRVPWAAGAPSAPTHDPRPAEAAALAFGSVLRSADRTWAEGERVFLLLPETDRGRGEALIARLQVETRLPMPDRVRLAAFPDDGLTSGALIAALDRPAESAHPIPFRSARLPELAGAATSFTDRDPGAASGERLG
ncbi:MAG: hypothetical protein A2X23_04325 [Chloroflexi bacterium GWC2_73_18]|nr:MAG: hypothetical protein A2X23_04325 [Chloroflexi bacterium GWC2_73_18]